MVEITDKINSKIRTITNRIPISDRFLVTGGPILLLEILLFLGPILIMFYIAVIQMENLQLVHEFSLQNYAAVFSGAANQEAIKNTVFLSMLTTFTAAVVAYPFA
ncbi:MAG: ABC-type spermidine/putrescine transport system permease subunit I, partial [Natronomonas sp.]